MAWQAPDVLTVGVGYTENWQVFLQNPTAPLRPQLWEGRAVRWLLWQLDDRPGGRPGGRPVWQPGTRSSGVNANTGVPWTQLGAIRAPTPKTKSRPLLSVLADGQTRLP